MPLTSGVQNCDTIMPLTSGVQNCGRMLEKMIQYLDFVVGSRVSLSPDVIHVMNETRPVIVNGNEK